MTNWTINKKELTTAKLESGKYAIVLIDETACTACYVGLIEKTHEHKWTAKIETMKIKATSFEQALHKIWRIIVNNYS